MYAVDVCLGGKLTTYKSVHTHCNKVAEKSPYSLSSNLVRYLLVVNKSQGMDLSTQYLFFVIPAKNFNLTHAVIWTCLQALEYNSKMLNQNENLKWGVGYGKQFHHQMKPSMTDRQPVPWRWQGTSYSISSCLDGLRNRVPSTSGNCSNTGNALWHSAQFTTFLWLALRAARINFRRSSPWPTWASSSIRTWKVFNLCLGMWVRSSDRSSLLKNCTGASKCPDRCACKPAAP